jgi:pimeloyl-ACP methyl ester carboxylesterase
MRYAVRGAENDGPTILFVHGWMGRFTFWDFNAPAIAKTNRTIAVDLPGYGASGAGRTNWTVAGYGDDIAHFIDALDLHDVVLVGHGMAGPIALRATSLVPGRVLGVIGVDTFQNVEFEFRRERMEPVFAAYESDFAGTCGQFVNAMFAAEADAFLKETVRAETCAGDPVLAVALLKDFAGWDHPGSMRAAGTKPIRAINGSYMATEIEINRKYAPDFDAVLVDGGGHFLFMERPEEFNTVLLRMIAELVGRGAGG